MGSPCSAAKSSPCLPQLEKALERATKDPAQAKIKNKWSIPWPEEPGRLQSMGGPEEPGAAVHGGQIVGHDLATEQQQQPR